ncbi:DNA primase [Bartonella ancashensis]|uniref:DNA primase n=1 Tax=Bartonella ancashensis TaxID=1318743 RepID=UPI0039E53177
MRFLPSFLNEIRAKLPISTIIGQRVTFDPQKSKPSRGDFWCCCPFHSEKTPSFHCDDRQGYYYCFGCGVKGDIFNFLCELDGLQFSEAVKYLANLAGMKLPALDPQSYKREMQKKNLYSVMAIATDFFQYSLRGREGEQARLYLNERGVTSELIERFRIGFAPARRTALKEALSARGISVKNMEDCGLLVSGEGIGVPYDRFRNRIIFPIDDLQGRVVAFGGRSLDQDTQVKYLNSSETALFHKGDMLYNASFFRRNFTKEKKKDHPVLVVEGYMDVIALTKAGFEKVVASLGTALTDAQITLLWKIEPNPVLCFDGDDAGLRAAFRVVDRILSLLKVGFSVRFVILPQGKDPDEIVRAGGGDNFDSYIQKSISLIEFLWLRATYGKSFGAPEARAALEKKLKQEIFTIKDEALRRYYLQDIKKRLFDFFHSDFLKRKNGSGYDRKSENGVSVGKTFSTLENSDMVRNFPQSIPLREAVILLTLAHYPDLWHENFEILSELELKNSRVMSFHQSMLEILGNKHIHVNGEMVILLEKKGHKAILEHMKNLVHRIGMRAFFTSAPIEDARSVLKQALYLHLQEHNLHKRLQDIEEQFMNNPSSEVFNLLREVKIELEKTQATEALIEGFGRWLDK